MDINALPLYDISDNPTGCCPRFNPAGWDEQDLHFKDKLFVKVTTRSIFHIPVNMGSVFPDTFKAIENANANSDNNFFVFSRDLSPWQAEHYFAVSKEISGQEMVKLTGDYLTRIFEGPYKNAPKWQKEMASYVKAQGKEMTKTYFFYTTCPKCAKYYAKNYVVVVAEIH
ncbi:MAG: hypothetical protein OQL06_08900 [Gammaproteobacteria bacterium]|nr:hypothetical protein [Gammaproteobacteria bacterium]